MEKANGQCLTLSVDEARKRLGISRGLMYEAIHNGQIPSIRIGRRILVPISALELVLADAGSCKDATSK